MKLALVFGAGALFVLGMVWGRLGLPPYEILRDAALAVWKSPLLDDRPAGRFLPARGSGDAADLSTAEDRDRIAELQALGYLGGTVPASGSAGVMVHRPEHVFGSVNLLSDGHAPEALLMDMDGRVLHRWQFSFERAFPDAADSDAPGRHYWRRVALLDEGDLLAIYEGQGLVRIDRNSKLRWAYDGRAHHDLDVLPDGTIYVLTREAEILPRINPDEPVLHDSITVLSPDGTERRRISIVEALDNSPYSVLLSRAEDSGDFLHTNTVEVLEGRLAHRIPAFARGHVLISIPMIDTIAVVDMAEGNVIWTMTGLWDFQHDPVPLENGNLLVFDNEGDEGASRILEIDPVTQEIPWIYSGKANDFYTATCGANQRLPNGNTLITESDNGRALEVTPGGEVVWEYHSPHRAGDDDELVATLFEVRRLPPDTDLSWLDPPPEPGRLAED